MSALFQASKYRKICKLVRQACEACEDCLFAYPPAVAQGALVVRADEHVSLPRHLEVGHALQVEDARAVRTLAGPVGQLVAPLRASQPGNEQTSGRARERVGACVRASRW